MRILVTNDDGVFAEGLWALVRELKNVAQVVVVAPDREQSAIGTAVTLRRSLKVARVDSPVPDVEAYAVGGTPTDSVVLAIRKLAVDRFDLLVSGINLGSNLGDDVLISGTVSAALQGCVHGLTGFAISLSADGHYLDNAARFAALLAKKLNSNPLPAGIVLNVNLPDLPAARIEGVKITRLATKSHTDSVEEDYTGEGKHYRLVRNRVTTSRDEGTDIWAVERGYISITPLHTDLSCQAPASISDGLCSELFREMTLSGDPMATIG